MKHKNAAHNQPANPFEAFRQLAYTFGVVELAALMSVNPGTLYNKADGKEEAHHQPTLRDVVLATRLTGDMQVLDALNESFGRAAFDVTQLQYLSDAAVVEMLLKFIRESGEFGAAVESAFASKKFTSMSLNQIRAEAFDVVGALMTLVARLEGLLDD